MATLQSTQAASSSARKRMFAEEGLILRHGQVPDLLGSCGISPVVSVASEGSTWQQCLIWRRKEIEAALSVIISVREESGRDHCIRTTVPRNAIHMVGFTERSFANKAIYSAGISISNGSIRGGPSRRLASNHLPIRAVRALTMLRSGGA